MIALANIAGAELEGMMSKQQNKQQKSQATQAQAKAPKGALSPSAAVRLWQGETITRSLLVAEGEGELAILATELQLTKKTRSVTVATRKRAEVRGGRIHPLDSPVTVGTARFSYDEALTAEEAAARAAKWLKKAKALDSLARAGDTEAGERAKSLRERAKTLAKAYNLKVEKDGSVAVVKSETEAEPVANAETETAEPANETK